MPTNFSWGYLDVNIKKRYSSYMNLTAMLVVAVDQLQVLLQDVEVFA
jgi:hypothetical protein